MQDSETGVPLRHRRSNNMGYTGVIQELMTMDPYLGK